MLDYHPIAEAEVASALASILEIAELVLLGVLAIHAAHLLLAADCID